MSRSVSVRVTVVSLCTSETMRFSFAPPSALMPPASLTICTASWAALTQPRPICAMLPVTGYSPPMFTASAARALRETPNVATAPAASTAPAPRTSLRPRSLVDGWFRGVSIFVSLGLFLLPGDAAAYVRWLSRAVMQTRASRTSQRTQCPPKLPAYYATDDAESDQQGQSSDGRTNLHQPGNDGHAGAVTSTSAQTGL